MGPRVGAPGSRAIGAGGPRAALGRQGGAAWGSRGGPRRRAREARWDARAGGAGGPCRQEAREQRTGAPGAHARREEEWGVHREGKGRKRKREGEGSSPRGSKSGDHRLQILGRHGEKRERGGGEEVVTRKN
jgi:hypothetical protein